MLFVISTDSISILMKSPEKRDVYRFLRKKSSNWDGFAIELGVALNFRQELTQNSLLNNNSKLDMVLEKWIEAQPSPVTWSQIVYVLEQLEYKDIAREVQHYLQQQNVIDQYSRKKNFAGK